MNVFSIQTDSDDMVKTISNEIKHIGSHSNEDMKVELKGYTHNRTGFILTVTNMEKMSDQIFNDWKQMIQNKGYDCTLQYDFQDGWVDVKCVQRKRKGGFMKVSHLQQMGYLSLLFFSIYMLWQKHSLHLE